MDRLTEYHAGKAVIKDKSLWPKAWEKLAKYEEVEENPDVEKIKRELMEYICDHVCISPKVITDEEQMEHYCEECKVEQYIRNIHAAYNNINEFVNSRAGSMVMMYRNFTFCDECIFCNTEQDCRWCSNKDGLDGHLECGTGCTRGRKVE